ncbi:RNA polymerase ECF family sigma subunit [Roseovarius halotolerans]|uniref:ECF RNA polymerase sigma factor SigW n=1 Tax=Roseovarius halotolerans TaxID=505353 RepID=A0A1X6Y7X6_9RHOB|nr:RNA polymerase sigma factor [Roseovarius halotolerans]RKT35132.1 RNA polymerase ECF family sigma subunit [Roseovarius halotolerans]SLN13395.1 ECF RNA polymerase sigma factor SigW [Roseovarius halotolerans]
MPLDAMKDISDDALLVLFANGDRAAARALTLRLTPRVLAHAQRLLGNAAEAEDVAQEAMLRLWKVAPDWRQGDAKVTTWLYRVVANLCTDRLRKARPLPLDAAPEPLDTAQGADAALQGAARVDALQKALVRLPRRQRQAVVLRHLEDLGNPEIAGIMEISVEAVESLLTRGRRALAAELAGRRAELGFADEHE